MPKRQSFFLLLLFFQLNMPMLTRSSISETQKSKSWSRETCKICQVLIEWLPIANGTLRRWSWESSPCLESLWLQGSDFMHCNKMHHMMLILRFFLQWPSIQDNLCKSVHDSFAIIVFICSSAYLGCLHRFAWLSPRSVYLTAIRLSFLLLGLGTFFGSMVVIIYLSSFSFETIQWLQSSLLSTLHIMQMFFLYVLYCVLLHVLSSWTLQIGALFEWLFVFCQQSNMLAWFFMDFRQLKVRVHADDE